MKYEFHAEALDEYEASAQYYANQQPGLDLRFIGAVEEAIELILESPRRWRTFDEDVRRCFTHIFPFAIMYVIEADVIYILAVAHCSREPGYWKHRLS